MVRAIPVTSPARERYFPDGAWSAAAERTEPPWYREQAPKNNEVRHRAASHRAMELVNDASNRTGQVHAAWERQSESLVPCNQQSESSCSPAQCRRRSPPPVGQSMTCRPLVRMPAWRMHPLAAPKAGERGDATDALTEAARRQSGRPDQGRCWGSIPIRRYTAMSVTHRGAERSE